MKFKPVIFALLVALATLPLQLKAEDDEEGLPPESVYVAIEPPFVTNYGGPGRFRYMKVAVSLRMLGSSGEASVTRHMPAIRDSLLSLFSIQTNETIGSAAGKEALRVESLAKIDALLAEEDGESFAEDLLFTEFVVHR